MVISGNKAIAIVIEKSPSPGKKVRPDNSDVIARIELDVTVEQLSTDTEWKKRLRREISSNGIRVEAINVIADTTSGHHVVVVVENKSDSIRRRKPVTRGGRSIEGPIPVRTLKTALRAK